MKIYGMIFEHDGADVELFMTERARQEAASRYINEQEGEDVTTADTAADWYSAADERGDLNFWLTAFEQELDQTEAWHAILRADPNAFGALYDVAEIVTVTDGTEYAMTEAQAAAFCKEHGEGIAEAMALSVWTSIQLHQPASQEAAA